MFFNFWKHKVNGHVISNECMGKLHLTQQFDYEPTSETATHRVEEYDNDDGFVTSLITASVIESLTDSHNDSDTSSSDSDFGGFDGGDSGGGGASGDF